MSLLKASEKLEVLRMLAKAPGRVEVTEERNKVKIKRSVASGAMKIVKSHMGGSPTTRNEMTVALAILDTRRNMEALEASEFPEVDPTAPHASQVTLSPRFEGLDLDDFFELLGQEPRRNSPLLHLAIWCGVLRSLRAIHRRGFLHCDVRPDNYCVAVGVRPIAGGGFEVMPDFGNMHAIDFGCALVPPPGRAAQLPDFPWIAPMAGYTSPDYDTARELRGDRAEAARAIRHLTAASDLWALGLRIQQMLDEVPPNPALEDAVEVHGRPALELLRQLPGRLGYPQGLPPRLTPMVSEEEQEGLLFDVALHDELIKEIERFTMRWTFEPVTVTHWPTIGKLHDETKFVAPGLLSSRRYVAPVLASVALLGLAAWALWPQPPMNTSPPSMDTKASTIADCKFPLRELDAALARGQSPDTALQPRLRKALEACDFLLRDPERLGNDLRVALVGASYYSLHLGRPAQAEQFARQLVIRYPTEYPGYFLTAKVRASEGNAVATLEALGHAADRGLTRANFEDERSQFAFLSSNPALASLERKLTK
ncbi:MAG: hypothetical protein ABIR26_08815 [Ramlibacter sp.]